MVVAGAVAAVMVIRFFELPPPPTAALANWILAAISGTQAVPYRTAVMRQV